MMAVDTDSRPRFDFITFLLLLIMLSLSAWSFLIADWTDHLGITVTVVQLAVIAGLALARSAFSVRIVSVFTLLYGLFIVGWQISRTLDPNLLWQDKILNVAQRIGIFINVVVSGQANRDAMIFVLLMAVLFWILGVLAAWAVFRRGEVLGAIIPCGIVVFTNAYFYDGEAAVNALFAAFWFLALLLIIRSEVTRRSAVWHSLRARVPAEISFLVNRTGVFLAVALILAAWIAPAFSKYDDLADFWDVITEPFDSTRVRIADVLGDLEGPIGVIPEYYAEVLNLDAGTEVEDLPVLQAAPERFPQNAGRFYWRSRVYDRYDNGSWSSTMTGVTPFDPAAGDIQIPSFSGRERIEVELRSLRDAMILLYLPSQPLWANRGAQVDARKNEDAVFDLVSVLADETIMPGETYRSVGSIAIPTSLELRNAGTNYPNWVLEYYLQLSDAITDRTIELAQRIIKGRDTPYDQAVAITQWLRENISYSRQTATPPLDVEPLDWFLFDYRIGFCNYYASAEVIMLRSLGIPARLAAGYARGTYEVEQGAYTATARDSHAWPEVFFPGIGWVEFEPTTSQDALDRPTQLQLDMMTDRDYLSPKEFGQETVNEPPRSDSRSQTPAASDRWASNPGMIYFLAVLNIVSLGLMLAVWLYVDPLSRIRARQIVYRNLNRVGLEASLDLLDSRIETTPTGKIYRRWSKLLQRAGVPVHPTQTPYERAENLAAAMPDISDQGRVIAKAYTQERFGNKLIALEPVQHAWRESRPRILRAWLRRRIHEWIRKELPGKE